MTAPAAAFIRKSMLMAAQRRKSGLVPPFGEALIQVSKFAKEVDSRMIIALIQSKMGTCRGETPFSDAMENGPQNEPSEVQEGEVMMDGPSGYTVSFTPGAALETSKRLLRGGLEAQGQIVEARRRVGMDEPK